MGLLAGLGMLAGEPHGRMVALAGKGHPRTASKRSASPEACRWDAALGSSNVLAGREPASPALGSVRPQRCPDPLPASVLVHAAWTRNRTRA